LYLNHDNELLPALFAGATHYGNLLNKNSRSAMSDSHQLCSTSNEQQCFSLTPNQHQPKAISQPTVSLSHSKSAPATSHSQLANQNHG